MSRRGVRFLLAVLLGRLARVVTRWRGGGSALPGYVARKIRPGFIGDIVSQWPYGVLVILGSNGKSTTTHMVCSILRAHGLQIFTNASGANMPQGIASALLSEVGPTGRLQADIGVIEVDEAYGKVLCRELRPRAGVVLDVQIDQIYRFFEPERVAQMFSEIADEIGQTLILNRDDDFLRTLGRRLEDEGRVTVSYFGARPEVLADAPHGLVTAVDYGHAGQTRVAEAETVVEVEDLSGSEAVIAIAGRSHTLRMPARGLHYAMDSAAALALCRAVLADRFLPDMAIDALAGAKTVYGRGEILPQEDAPIEILLLKNLASLQMNLDYLDETPDSVLFALDAGSKDPSWLYAADLSSLRHVDVVSGPKAAFVALRLAYAGIGFDLVEPDIEKAVRHILATPVPRSGKRTFILDYDQMLLTRKMLGYRDLEAGAA